MSQFLKDLSDGLADVIETVGPAIVRVEGRRRLAATGIVWSSDGVIVTSHHVVERDENIRIGFADGTATEATLVGRDPGTDIAVLRTQSEGLQVPTWVEFDDLSVGHLVLALGRPGEAVQATLGVVSALGEVMLEGGRRRRGGSQLDRYIKTDVVMYPGFSGGPLVNAVGAVAGMNTSIVRGSSLAIPAPTIRRVAETLLQHGRMRRGYLGVTSQPAALPTSIKDELQQEMGLLIIAVEPESPADQSGLLLGDTIVSLDGYAVTGLDELLGLLTGDRIGAAVPIGILRGGELLEITVTIGERP
ncbi:MAG: PDZ domain-containing protein [Chloroflexi bacterium]|nr:PDZ domain-containing protein [Chloroflexota bacterium]